MHSDEQDVLTEYVWNNCLEQMTELERHGWKALASGNDGVRHTLLLRFGRNNDPEVVEAFSHDHEAFRIAVRDRILRDHPEVVAKCPKCHRVLRTPRAKQCRWCYFDWHDT